MIEIRLIGGAFDGVQDLACELDPPSHCLLIGWCVRAEGCQLGLGPERHKHPWFWLPQEAARPRVATVYNLLDCDAGVARYVALGTTLPV